jgi:hypothetical protein
MFIYLSLKYEKLWKNVVIPFESLWIKVNNELEFSNYVSKFIFIKIN